jgi:hypothetical protein
VRAIADSVKSKGGDARRCVENHRDARQSLAAAETPLAIERRRLNSLEERI